MNTRRSQTRRSPSSPTQPKPRSRAFVQRQNSRGMTRICARCCIRLQNRFRKGVNAMRTTDAQAQQIVRLNIAASKRCARVVDGERRAVGTVALRELRKTALKRCRRAR